jgi:hypothetical protein
MVHASRASPARDSGSATFLLSGRGGEGLAQRQTTGEFRISGQHSPINAEAEMACRVSGGQWRELPADEAFT